MRSKVHQDTRPGIAPFGIPDEPRPPVAVEHSTGGDAPEPLPGAPGAPPQRVRRETMRGGGTAGDTLAVGERLELENLFLALGPERFFDEHVLAVPEQISQKLAFRRVGDAAQRRIIGSERHVPDATVIGFGPERIDTRDVIGPGKSPSFLTLHAQPDYDRLHHS